MTRLDKQLASIDPALIKQLSEPLSGQAHMRDIAQAQHWLTPDQFEVHPTAIGRTLFERVHDVRAAPVTDHAKAQELLAKLNALHPDPPVRGR